jgi:outer membrane protein assembly factor BamE
MLAMRLPRSFPGAGQPLQSIDHIATALPMPAFPSRASRLVLAIAGCAAALGCGSFDNVSNRLVGSITPYRVEVVQGNFVSKEQVEAIKPGMSRQQVRDILGTPLVTSIFHGDRWDYVFTLKRQGVPPQERRLAVFFKGSLLDHFEGDEMPSEAEFVATLDNKRKRAKVPELEASEESLKQFSSVPAPAAAPPPPDEPAAAASYPPLEAPAR